MRTHAAITWACCIAVELTAGCAREQPDGRPRAAPHAQLATAGAMSPPRGPDGVSIVMRRVRLHLDRDITLDVGSLRGLMVSRQEGRPPVFDDPGSYVLRVDAADMSLDTTTLTALLNEHVFAHDDAPLRDVSVRTGADGWLVLKGKLHKGISVPFSSKASVSASPGGMLRLHVSSVSALGVPVKGLMGLAGLDLQNVMHLKRGRDDVSVEGDDLLVSPGAALPPPAIEGRLTKAAVAGDRLVLTFGERGARAHAPDAPDAHGNYVYFHGGTIRFGKLTMRDADLQLIDADAGDPFDFYPARYYQQLVAGYSKNTLDGGLRTFMPDYDDLQHHRQSHLQPPDVHRSREAHPSSSGRRHASRRAVRPPRPQEHPAASVHPFRCMAPACVRSGPACTLGWAQDRTRAPVNAGRAALTRRTPVPGVCPGPVASRRMRGSSTA